MYPINLRIPNYITNDEYRRCLRELFKMKVENYPEKIKELEEKLGEEFDEETRDEIEYDDESAKKMMDYILENTKDMIIIKTLY